MNRPGALCPAWGTLVKRAPGIPGGGPRGRQAPRLHMYFYSVSGSCAGRVAGTWGADEDVSQPAAADAMDQHLLASVVVFYV